MKRQFVLAIVAMFFLVGNKLIWAQKDVTVTADSNVAAGLDLQAVGDVFKDSKDLEDFEKNLNDPDKGINNLDLNNDGEVDYIRPMEKTDDNTHLVILQAQLGKDDYQDVATIEVQKDKDDYNVQIQGNKDVYGKDVYVVPAVVHVSAWPIIGLMYGPAYHPYRSAFYFGFYPHWWHPFHPVARHIYYNRVFPHRRAFVTTRTTHVRTVARLHYRPHSSTLVVRKKTVVRHGRVRTVKRERVKVRRR
jgi:hypothetical protein